MQASRVTDRIRSGFTIVEMAVATAVLSVLVLLLMGVFGQVSRAWVAGEGQTERRRSARAVADFIAAELSGALLPVETVSAANKGNLQFLINPPAAQVPDDYRNADAIFWQAPIATETSFGEIAEIGYFVKWEKDGENAPMRPLLCRFFVNPSISDPDNKSGLGTKANPDFLIYDVKPNAWLSKPLLDSVAPATKAKSSALPGEKTPTYYKGLFADNIVGLWVRSYGLDGKELDRSFDSRKGYPLLVKYTDFAGAQKSRTEQRYLPAVVKLSLAQIDSQFISRLDSAQDPIREIARESGVRDAGQFLERVRADAEKNPQLATLLPGLRIYATEIQLESGR